MLLPLSLKGLEGRRVMLKPAGLVSGPRVFIGDAPAPRKRRSFFVRTFLVRKNDGTWGDITLKPRFFDAVPKVEYDGTAIDVVRPLRWYEYAWMALPLFLALEGGALGAFIGLTAVYFNSRIFRSGRTAWARYGLTAMVSLGAAAAFVVSVTILQLLLRILSKPS